jgi:2-polyprenyl-3-methyl-5-hydroxy-6-metoxy-1,4-benzoquinol methylase
MNVISVDIWLLLSSQEQVRKSLDAVREKNFSRIINILKSKFDRCNTALDVGCSRGIFLETADNAGFSATGIEPDTVLAQECRNRGYTVMTGFFPDTAELSGKKFDVLAFNDSFEHIPNSTAVVEGIKNHLNKDGIVVVNLPTSDGLMFRAAYFLYKAGIHTAFDRLWQKGFTSPHLHYFNLHNLKCLFEKCGFDLRYTTPLSYYTIKGLWSRLVCKSSFFVSLFTWMLLMLLYPLFTAKSDCFVAFFSLREGKR